MCRNKESFGKKKIPYGEEATLEKISKFSDLIPHHEWFSKLWSEYAIGYTESPKGTGLCEYISISMLFFYQELFISSGYFTDEEFEHYFVIQEKVEKIGMPWHFFSETSQKEKSFITKLWELNKKQVNFIEPIPFKKAINRWVKGHEIEKRISLKSQIALVIGDSSEKILKDFKVPVALSYPNRGGHSVVIIGYDSQTKSYLVHYGWVKKELRIVRKKDIWSWSNGGFWVALYDKNEKKLPLKKRFFFEGKKYSWKELKEMGFTAKDIDRI
ncbi:hypothetical protein SSABA_v1c03650 [Spiroplasma sabaudiense Ar-1343]|uniref:Uncharacterized protein n=1 Tax=Spiroplasma sabaudiense Ar-1343 TaxID=1276257 RepID=W6AJ83_9MOLU|nr:hypothetical protein [Spiroplasma sabaudiense]AHI53774.1 hypothetical protein SSABA_v1c03650 [Spiroplasma sabaudiense Ar-1343]